MHIGNRLGFYRALVERGDSTPGELADRTGTAERYVREWLEQQAVAGFLSVDDAGAAAGARRYGLPVSHRAVFVEEDSLSYLAPLATLAIGVLGCMDALLDAYRTGGGVPYEAVRRRHAGRDRGDQSSGVCQRARRLACVHPGD